jgi:SAM-dependent methyltransferase
MMLGLGDEFDYFRCADCGCLQLEEVPSDLGRFYPSHYYSLAMDPQDVFRGRLKARARTARDRWAVLGEGPLGRLLLLRWPEPALESLRLLKLDRGARLLDVGCGTGLHLFALQRLGFRSLLGVDPFLPADRFFPPALPVRAIPVHEVEGEGVWDVVSYHHSFEHVTDPLEQLRTVSRLLAPGGTCLIRVPVSDSEAWERYGTDWVQLDAPRHLFLHTRASLARLAEEAGLRVERVLHDSTAFQFWGSEQYRRGIPLLAQGGPPDAWARTFFSAGRLRAFRREAHRLNVAGRGDQAVFLLRRG